MPDDEIKRTTINAGKHWCELIEAHNHLKERVTTPSGRSPQEMVVDAGQGLADLTDDFLAVLDEGIAEMQALAARLGGRPEDDDPLLARIYRICHEVKGQGRTFGYALVSSIGHSLCSLLERAGPEETRLAASIATHLDAFALVQARRIAGDGGALGEQLTGALWAEVEVVGGPPPPAPRLTGGNLDSIELPRLVGVRPAAADTPQGSSADTDTDADDR